MLSNRAISANRLSFSSLCSGGSEQRQHEHWKPKFSLTSDPMLAALVSTEVVYCDLFALFGVSQSVDCVALDTGIPVFLCIVVASVVDAECFEQDTGVYSVDSDWQCIRSNDALVLFSDGLVKVDIVHGQEVIPLGRVKTVDLLEWMFAVLLILREGNDGGFRKNPCAFRNPLGCDKTFSLSIDVLDDIHHWVECWNMLVSLDADEK